MLKGFIGKTFRHFKGGFYIIEDYARYEPKNEECVIYRSLKTGEVWVRPSKDFFGFKVLENGKSVRRFERVNIS